MSAASRFPRLTVAPRRFDGTPKFRCPVDGLDLGAARWVETVLDFTARPPENW